MMDEGSPKHRAFALPGSRLNYAPDKQVEVLHIDLFLEPDLERAILEGVCTTTIRALDRAVPTLTLDSVDLEVFEATRQGRPIPFLVRDRKLDVTFDPPLFPREECSFSVRYRAERPRHGLFFIEPSPDYPDRVRHVWSQSQDQNARYWFPCIDYPNQKQTTSATILVPQGTFALSNGELVECREQEGRTIFRYRQDIPHSTYLVTLVAGPFSEVAQAGRVSAFYYVLPGREADGERAFGKTPQMLEVFEKRIGVPYPFARYSQIAVSEFIFGGMENTGATTQTERTLHDERAHLDFSSDPLVSHELAHQWFGDLLTCRDWSHAWLNEGFATFFEAVYREADLGEDEYLYDILGCVERYVREDAERYRRPIVCKRFRDPIELFDRHLYEKGAGVLHMLRGDLGEERFWRAIAGYVRANSGRNVETIDFIRAIEEQTGRNVRAFFDQWVFRGGHPEIKVGFSYDGERGTATVAIEQTQFIGDDDPAFAFDAAIRIDERLLRVRVERQRETVTIPVEREPRCIIFDPGAFVLGDVTYAIGAERARAVLGSRADVVAKIRAARELAKDGSAASRRALREAFAAPEFWGVLAEIARSLGETRAPWACEILIEASNHAHPKVRRAACEALGNFRDVRAADALLPAANGDASYFVQHAALHALGKTRDARAFGVLQAAVTLSSWNGIIESGAALGLGELADPRALPLLIQAARPGGDEARRRAALGALAVHAAAAGADRAQIVDAVISYLDDPAFMVCRAAIRAAEQIGDARALSDLERVSAAGFDGRVRRDAAEAAVRIRESQMVPAQVAGLRTDLDVLREEQRRIQEKIETLSRS